MSFEMSVPMPPEDQAELDYMKQWPNKDGTLGWALSDGPEAVEWFEYYRARRPHKAEALWRALAHDKQYMVAARFPQWFDRSWHPISEERERLIPPKPATLTAEQRDQIINRALKWFKPTANGKD